MVREEEALSSFCEELRDRSILAAEVTDVGVMLQAQSPTSRQYTELVSVVKSEVVLGRVTTVT